MTLRRTLEGDEVKTVRARIVAEIDRETDGFLYAVAILEPRADFSGRSNSILAAGRRGAGTVADGMQLLPAAKVVYLNEMELKIV